MSTTTDLGASLLAKQDALEKAFADLQPAVVAEVKQATDEIKKILEGTVLSPTVVKQVLDRMDALKENVTGFTSSVADLYTPPADEPPATGGATPAPTEPTPPADNPPV